MGRKEEVGARRLGGDNPVEETASLWDNFCVICVRVVAQRNTACLLLPDSPAGRTGSTQTTANSDSHVRSTLPAGWG